MSIKKLLIILTVIIFSFVFRNIKTEAQVSCFEYGIGAYYDILSDGCKCMTGYLWSTNLFGAPVCISANSYCQNKYGVFAKYDSLNDSCGCSNGYIFGKDLIGNTSCISLNQYCKDKYGFNASYNSLNDSCGCSNGYVMGLNVLGQTVCVDGSSYCLEKHGSQSRYDVLKNACTCQDGYTFDENNKCVQKQNNVYFKLLELDTSNKRILIKSDYDFQRYLISYGSGCFNMSFSRYLNKNIVLNLGTDFFIDKYDKVVLQDDNEVCDVTKTEKVDSSFSLANLVCQEEHGATSHAQGNNCICEEGYELNGNSQCAKREDKQNQFNYIKKDILGVDEQEAESASIITHENSSVINKLFTDVDENHPYVKAIEYVKEKNIVAGYSDGTYKQDNSINRAEFTKIIIEAKYKGLAQGSNCFQDVKDEWFAKYVCYAKQLGIIGGYPDGTFKANNSINLVEALKVILMAFNIELPKSEDGQPWYQPYLYFAQGESLSFVNSKKQDELVTRGEMAEMIMWTSGGN